MADRNIELSRRRILGGLGTIGVASAGAGLGTSAFFSDEEQFTNNAVTAGTLDMKIAWQEHYADWLGEGDAHDGDSTFGEADDVHMPAPGETPTFRLPAPLGAPDARDIELVINSPEGEEGRDFLRDSRLERENGGLYGSPADLCAADADVPDNRPLIDLSDVKPGDFGFALFRFQLCDNPGYLWLTGALESAAENGTNEPEAGDPDEDGDPQSTDPADVELLDAIQVAFGTGITNDLAAPQPDNLFPDPDPNSPVPQPDNQLSLREFLALVDGDGLQLVGNAPASQGGGTGRNCFSGSTGHYVSIVWWLPVDHANQVQSDRVVFDLGFRTEQCRHNDGLRGSRLLTLAGDSPQGQGVGFANPWDTSSTLAHRGSGSWGTVDHSANNNSYKQGFYFGAQFSDFGVLPEFTVEEIEEISYWLHEPSPLQGNDIYLNIYTEQENDGEDTPGGFYDSRLQALPAEANNGSPSFTPGQWNEFSTETGATNTLNFYDSGRSSIGQGPGNAIVPKPSAGVQPTLADLQSGDIDWTASPYNLSLGTPNNNPYSYHDETVLALSLQTNSTSPSLVANIDDVAVKLTNGAELVLDLEP